MDFATVITSVGIVGILGAFVLNLFGFVTGTSKLFHVLNGLGSILAIIGAVMIKLYPFILLNALWAVVSAIGFVKAFGHPSGHVHGPRVARRSANN